MKFFRKIRKRDNTIIDLGKLQRRIAEQSLENAGEYKKIPLPNSDNDRSFDISDFSGSGNALGFLGDLARANESSASSNMDSSLSTQDSNFDSFSSEERKKRLRKRFRLMTEKLEENSNKIYDILQKLELIEKKIERIERKTGIKGEGGDY